MYQDKALKLLSGWLTAIRQQDKAIRRKNRLIKRLRAENAALLAEPSVPVSELQEIYDSLWGSGLQVRERIGALIDKTKGE
jgi:hypothetical protein